MTVESQAVETPARINKEVFREYLHQMTDTLAFAGIDADYDAIVPVIMRLPEVVSTETESISDEEHAALIAATEAAAARLDAFRMQEGAILIADLLGRVDRIESYKEEVVPFEKARTETIKARILDNLEKLQADVDRNRAGAEMTSTSEKPRHHRREGPALRTTADTSAKWPRAKRAQAANWASLRRKWAARSTPWGRRPTNRTSRFW